MTLTSTWKQFDIPFTSFVGGTVPLNPGDLWSIEFQPGSTGAFGLAKNPSTKAKTVVEGFLGIERAIERPYGDVRSALERRGRPIGALDAIIAAHAMVLRAVLVTNNLRKFRRVRGGLRGLDDVTLHLLPLAGARTRKG